MPTPQKALSPLAMACSPGRSVSKARPTGIGVLVRVVMIGVAIYLWRNPDIAKAGEDEGANGRSSPLMCRQFRSLIP